MTTDASTRTPIRQAGILMHPTSLAGPHGMGDIGACARELVDFLAAAGMTLWQVLPLGPTGNFCPYVGWSAMAGNPMLVDLQGLKDAGLLDDPLPPLPSGAVIDHDAVTAYKAPRLDKAAATLLASPDHPLHAKFVAWKSREGWARRASLFWVLKKHHAGKAWWDWEPALRDRDQDALDAASTTLAAEIDRTLVTLFFFEHQWKELRSYCHVRGVRLLGDLPIYVDADSADVWVNRHLFCIGEDGRPTLVSGVPPDYFSELGQLWGNPLYRWDKMAEDDYAWWRQRLTRAFAHCDLVRIDHFRAFSAYWEIPAGAPDARKGRWVKGPGAEFFDVLRRELGDLPLIAEDLGTIDDDVHALRLGANLPGMRVLQFAFDGDPRNTHLPHNHTIDSVVYPGTHDNDTTVGWWQSSSSTTRAFASRYLRSRGDDIAWDLIREAFASVGKIAIVAMQDVLSLDTRSRMNNPGAREGNWVWKLERPGFDPRVAARLRDVAWLYGRVG